MRFEIPPQLYEALRDVHPNLAKTLLAFLEGKKRRARDAFTNEVHYEAFRSLRYKWLRHVYIAPRYVFLCYSDLGTYALEDYWRTLAVNDDGRLVLTTLKPPCGVSAALVCQVGDVRVWRIEGEPPILDFEVDAVHERVSRLPPRDSVRVRLQGEVVGVFERCGDLREEAREAIMAQFRSQLDELVEHELAARLMYLLSTANVTARRLDRRTVAFSYRGRGVARPLMRFIAENLYVDDVLGDHEVEVREDSVEYRFEGGEARVEYLGSSWPRSEPLPLHRLYVAFDRGFRVDAGIPLFRAARRVVDDIVGGVELEEQEFRLGNHVIQYRGLPRTYVAQLALPFKSYQGAGQVTLTASLSLHFIAPGELRLVHPQHGAYRYEVVEPVVARFEALRNHEVLAARLSHYAVKRLVERYSE